MLAFAERLPERFRWFLFCLIGKISKLRASAESAPERPDSKGLSTDMERKDTEIFIWIFCSTIGELNACNPLISLLQKRGNLVLLTDRPGYEEAFSKQYPDAVVVHLLEGGLPCEAVVDRYTPREFYLAEIPIIPADAPCRLSYSLLRHVKRCGASIYMVNGWLYGYQPNCRQDAIERDWFTRDYMNCFDLICVQTTEVKKRLMALGAQGHRIHVTGNMKFDALNDTDITLNDAINNSLLRHFRSAEGKVVVAGCLSDTWEYQLLLNAFSELIETESHSKLILAPRHPESIAQMNTLREMGELSPHKVVFKSDLDSNSSLDFDIMILDTIGELRSYYSLASIAYVGRNHNVLEPLSFGKPVIVLSGWEQEFPSYPVYKVVSEKGLLIETEIEDFTTTLIHVFRAGLLPEGESIRKDLEELSGATRKNADLIGIKHFTVTT
jgi:3-deoxy-D-manno-octulosonic-acid transferase